MDINKILAQVDTLFEENKGEEAERLMQQSIVQAVREQDDGSLLQLLNELLGFYRETSRKEDAFQVAAQAIAHAKRMGLEGTIPYATTLLNVANAYRACGSYKESMDYYLKVQEIYERELAPDDMFMAGLKNNLSLLYQEMGDFAKAKECQIEALSVVEKKGALYELGVTYANLANTCIRLEEEQEAYGYAAKSIELFNRENVRDSHYAAALAAAGACLYRRKEYEKALQYYRQAQQVVEASLGRNEYYHRLQEYISHCRGAMQQMSNEQAKGQEAEDEPMPGLTLAREYYEIYGRPMIEEKFPAYADKIAVGLAGRGSDCFGYDDAASRDHDWGPDFCMWVTDETYEAIGDALQQAYEQLPREFKGYKRAPHVNGRNRRGVIKISDFFREVESGGEICWRQAGDFLLAALVNGEVFRDDEGVFTAMRDKLKAGYPEGILYLKIAESAARFSQAAQYNYSRMLRRGDWLTAQMMVWDGVKEAMKLQHYIEGKYPPHDKWLFRSLQESQEGGRVAQMLEDIIDGLVKNNGDKAPGGIECSGAPEGASEPIERLGAYFAMELYRLNFISDTDSYLDAHSAELLYKASLASDDCGQLAERIAKLEFEAFDKVQNEGGRASCQNDWETFSIMRKSQYLTWNKTMLLQYLYDFDREYRRGHNLIEEKYGRMMESTAPDKYEEIKGHFPVLSREKKDIIEQIVGIQVGWMEEFAREYPALADNARSIHTMEDSSFNTSYETYLRGELGTYSDKMLELYGRYVAEYARSGRNLAYAIMENSVKMYGYNSIEEAERRS